MINVSAWSIRRPVPAILLFIFLTVTGLLAFRALQIQDFPDIDLPAVVVGVALPGATPSQMESEVTRKIEGALASLALVEHISSSVTEGTSETSIAFRVEKNMQEAVDEVRNAVASVRAALPPDVRDPYIARITVSGVPILTYAVESPGMDELDLSWFVDDTVGKSLLHVPGVGSVIRQGGVDREVAVQLDPTRLQSLNITGVEVSTQVFAVQRDASGGRGTVGGAEQSLRSVGTVASVADLDTLYIPLADGRRVRLGEIATVHDTQAERRHMALFDGKPVVSFRISKSKGHSELTVAEGVRAALANLRAVHPEVKIREISSSLKSTEEQYDSAMRALYEGALLTLFVVWLFLRDARLTLISAVALPLSLIPTFLIMYLLGYTLNTVTLLALTLVVGILVDDAIVEVENIVRHLRMGKTPMQAALDATDEIGLAVIATSLTLVAVFLPTAFMGGVSGKVFQQFGWTASVAVLGSLLVARLLTPMMAAYLLKDSHLHAEAKEGEQSAGPLMRRYLLAARWCLERPFKTCAMATTFFIFSFLLAADLSVDFIPAGDSGEITVTVTMPPGTPIGATAAVAEAARLAATQEPEVSSVFTSIGVGSLLGGDSSGSFRSVDNATLVLALKSQRARSQQAVEASLRQRFASIAGVRFALGSGESGEKFSVVLSGNDRVLLESTAQAMAREMRGLQDFGGVSTSANLVGPEIVIRPDPVRSADLGVTTLAIGQVVRVATSGDYDTNLAKLNLPSRQVPIRIQLDEHSRGDLETLARLRVPSRNGTVPLASVATLSLESGPSRIDRLDRVQIVTVDMELNGRPLSDAAELVDALPIMKRLPPGVTRSAIGDFEAQQKLFGGFTLAILAGVLCVYAVLVLLFDDFMQPGTILAALPLSTGGAFAALWIFDFALSMPSLIGVIMLMGVVTKNSILLVDYAIMAQRDNGLSRTDAILDACHKRARPIVMTTVAMIAGMLPMALGLQGDASFRAPMAVVVIGGLLTSTALSLLVAPVVYELVDDFKKKLLRAWSWERWAVFLRGWFARKLPMTTKNRL